MEREVIDQLSSSNDDKNWLAEYDWAASPFGPKDYWPLSLAIASDICLESRFPIILFWGEDLVQFYNEAYQLILGERHPRAFGQRASECWSDIWSQVGPMLTSVLQGSSTWSDDLLLPIETDGVSQERYFTFSYSPLREGHRVVGVFCAVTETTERVLRERKAGERLAELAELDRVKTDFFNNVSHEFRTPLTLMLAPLEIALNVVEAPEIRLELETCYRNAIRLKKLVDSLLTLSRLQAAQEHAKLEPVDVRALTRDFASAFRSNIEQAGLGFFVECSGSKMIALLDPMMWEAIVFNLLSNALKFTFDGSIRVSQHVEAETIVLRVSDTGSGIPESELPNLFKRFHRVENTKARSAEGSGIGLALVSELVKLHKGSISVTSGVGVGTTIEVRVPLHRVYTSPVDRAERTSVEPFLMEAAGWLKRKPGSASSPATKSGELVLVVDDNADLRAYLDRVLADRWHVATASNALDALEFTKRELPDIVVTDLMMPGVGGFEFIRRLRSDDATRHIPVIVLTARADPDTHLQAMLSRADDYLAKPFTADELVARVATRLELVSLRMRTQRDETFLLDASRVLASALDAGSTLENLTSVVLPSRADWCRVDALDAKGRYRTVSIAHADTEKADLAKSFIGTSSLIVEGGASVRVLRSGATELFSDLEEPSIANCPLDEEARGRYEQLGLRSALVIPLTARGRTVGTFSLFYGESMRRYDETDVPVLEELGRRAAIAYQNALLYDDERRNALRNATIAERLQIMFLPQVLPDIPGFRIDACYKAAESDLSVGGDWYAALTVRKDSVVFGIGDITGHGLEAAVRMGRCRQSILTAAVNVQDDPAELLLRVNQILCIQESLVTATVGFLNPTTGDVAYASAGHPPAILRARDGAVRFLKMGGTMLGVSDLSQYQTFSDRLEPGDALFLYTDGLVEIDHDAAEGQRALANLVASTAITQATDPSQWLVRTAVGARRPIDDIAVLTLMRS